MTRINTSINALQAQKNMNRANSKLETTMQRLSTGLKINKGSDDPSGLIGANLIASDIMATKQGITNSERGNMVISTADSYLSKVRERLDDMRRLINEASNTVSMTPDQTQADQLVIDASIEAIDRIAKTANFQGLKLFDGSMGYSIDVDSSGNIGNLTDVQIQQANLDPLGGQDIRVSVTEAAEQATIKFNSSAATSASGGIEAFTKENEASANKSLVLEFAGNRILVTSTGGDLSGLGYGSTGLMTAASGNGSLFTAQIDNAAYATGAVSGGITEGTNGAYINLNVGTSSGAGGYITYSFSAGDIANAITGLAYGDGTLTATVLSDSGKFAQMEVGDSGAAYLGSTTSATQLASHTDTGYGGATAQVSLGHSVRLDSSDFVGGADNNNDDQLVLRRVDGGAFNATINIVSSEAEAGVSVKNGNEYVININTAALDADTNTTDEFAEDIGKFLIKEGYSEELYATYETTGTAAGGYAGTIPGGGESATGQSNEDYLGIAGIGGAEAANGLSVALVFGAADNVGYDAVDNKLTITLMKNENDDGATAVTGQPDWTQIATDLQALGLKSNGLDFSNAYVVGFGADTAQHLSIREKENYEMEGNTGVTGGYTLRESSTFEVRGSYGMEVMTLGKGSTRAEVVEAFNMTTDSTGIMASQQGTSINITSSEYGSASDITITMIEEKGHFDINLDKHYDEGKDAVATINGFGAVGEGNLLRISNSTLQAEIRVSAGTAEASRFNVRAGGGAQFQLGPEVMKSQQANLSLGSLSSGKLGNSEVGYLYQLKTGGEADLWTNTEKAASIVKAVGTYVDSLSGRLGAFQNATVQTNIFTLQDAVENMSASESLYRDADYAAESTALSKNQVLVQANTSVLSIANQQAQNVLSLIR